MKLHVIGSSSKGNSYLFQGKDESLVIEAGCKVKGIKQALDFNLAPLRGVLVSHSHLDHSRYAPEFAENGIKVHALPETLAVMDIAKHHNSVPVKTGMAFWIGGFHVLAFNVVHDVPTLGYLVKHHESGKFCFLTDTHYSEYKFNGLNNIIIEANYSEKIIQQRLEQGSIDHAYYRRVAQSHMSLETAMRFFMANDLSAVNNIVLIHLSDGNSDAPMFHREVTALTGKAVHIADKGMIINFDKYPF